ncbi:MAG: hypothetical protein ABI699_16530, partial [Caldimonas sp.]
MPFEQIALAAQRRETAELEAHFRRPGRSRIAWLAFVVLAAVALVVVSLPASAQSGEATLPLLIGQSAGSTSYSVPVQT